MPSLASSARTCRLLTLPRRNKYAQKSSQQVVMRILLKIILIIYLHSWKATVLPLNSVMAELLALGMVRYQLRYHQDREAARNRHIELLGRARSSKTKPLKSDDFFRAE